MTRSITDYLYGNTRLEKVTLTLLAGEQVQERDLNTFYERSVALAAISSESKRLAHLVDELARIANARNKPDLLARINRIRSELEVSREVLSHQSETGEQVDVLQDQGGVSTIERIAREAIAVSSRPGGVDAGDDRELEAQVLRTKLAGLLTQLNIQMSHANRYQIERAKYGGQLVPPRLEIAIEEMANGMAKVQAEVRQTRAQLAQVAPHRSARAAASMMDGSPASAGSLRSSLHDVDTDG